MSAINALIERLLAYANGDEGATSSNLSRTAPLTKKLYASKSQNGAGSARQTSSHDAQDVGDELLALKSIYGEDSVVPLLRRDGLVLTSVEGAEDDDGAADLEKQGLEAVSAWEPSAPINISITIALDVELNNRDDDDPAPSVRLLVKLPAGYPSCDEHPSIQLLSKYIGSHGTDHILFGQVMRIFRSTSPRDDDDGSATHSSEHVDFVPGQVALFDGVDKARELTEQWYSHREAVRQQRVEEQRPAPDPRQIADENGREHEQHDVDEQGTRHNEATTSELHLVSAPALVDRKSTFIGHAAYISHPEQVSAALAHLLNSDKRIARATHPTMHAWICRTDDGVVHRDCDDDGETAAGGRLAHLLDLLHLDNVLVIVTRWYGGIQLGPDRFKLINRAARDALELLGAIDGALNKNTGSRGDRSSANSATNRSKRK